MSCLVSLCMASWWYGEGQPRLAAVESDDARSKMLQVRLPVFAADLIFST